MIGETEDEDNDTDDNKLLFIGSNKKKIDFNTFKMPLNFLSDIYNVKTSLKRENFFKNMYMRK